MSIKKTILALTLACAGAVSAVVVPVAVGTSTTGCDPKTAKDVATVADFGVCVLDTYAADYGQPYPVIVAAAIKNCGGDAAAIDRILDAQKHAESIALAKQSASGAGK